MKVKKISFLMVFLLIAALIFVLVQTERAQKTDERRVLKAADVPATAKQLTDFAPKDWKITAEITGDLNGDKLADTVLTVAFDDSETALIIVFKNANGSFRRAAVAPNALHCDCGSMLGDGTPAVEINKGQIILKGWSGSREIRDITMRFRREASTKRFLLIGDDYKLTDRLELTTHIVSSNYLTNLRILTEIVEDKKEKRKQTKIKIQRVYLDELDYQDYWEKFEQ